MAKWWGCGPQFISIRSSSSRWSTSWNKTQFISGNIRSASMNPMFIIAALLNIAGLFCIQNNQSRSILGRLEKSWERMAAVALYLRLSCGAHYSGSQRQSSIGCLAISETDFSCYYRGGDPIHRGIEYGSSQVSLTVPAVRVLTDFHQRLTLKLWHCLGATPFS